jgi:hypothetical protein
LRQGAQPVADDGLAIRLRELPGRGVAQHVEDLAHRLQSAFQFIGDDQVMVFQPAPGLGFDAVVGLALVEQDLRAEQNQRNGQRDPLQAVGALPHPIVRASGAHGDRLKRLPPHRRISSPRHG